MLDLLDQGPRGKPPPLRLARGATQGDAPGAAREGMEQPSWWEPRTPYAQRGRGKGARWYRGAELEAHAKPDKGATILRITILLRSARAR
jgi:hypothetical protein